VTRAARASARRASRYGVAVTDSPLVAVAVAVASHASHASCEQFAVGFDQVGRIAAIGRGLA
jgi:hypothetical protein